MGMDAFDGKAQAVLVVAQAVARQEGFISAEQAGQFSRSYEERWGLPVRRRAVGPHCSSRSGVRQASFHSRRRSARAGTKPGARSIRPRKSSARMCLREQRGQGEPLKGSSNGAVRFPLLVLGGKVGRQLTKRAQASQHFGRRAAQALGQLFGPCLRLLWRRHHKQGVFSAFAALDKPAQRPFRFPRARWPSIRVRDGGTTFPRPSPIAL